MKTDTLTITERMLAPSCCGHRPDCERASLNPGHLEAMRSRDLRRCPCCGELVESNETRGDPRREAPDMNR